MQFFRGLVTVCALACSTSIAYGDDFSPPIRPVVQHAGNARTQFAVSPEIGLTSPCLGNCSAANGRVLVAVTIADGSAPVTDIYLGLVVSGQLPAPSGVGQIRGAGLLGEPAVAVDEITPPPSTGGFTRFHFAESLDAPQTTNVLVLTFPPGVIESASFLQVFYGHPGGTSPINSFHVSRLPCPEDGDCDDGDPCTGDLCTPDNHCEHGGDGTALQLPDSQTGGTFNFTFMVGAEECRPVDPPLAIGFDYEVQIGSPSFSSVILPAIGDGSFELHLFDSLSNEFVFDRLLPAHVEHEFAVGGVERFRIMGIEEVERISPEDPTAFPTGITYTTTGMVTMTMSPVVVVSTSLSFQTTDDVFWTPESGVDSWNIYRGDLATLLNSQTYTQFPGSHAYATQWCGTTDSFLFDSLTPDPGTSAFYLVSAVANGLEGGLGSHSSGADRSYANACPGS